MQEERLSPICNGHQVESEKVESESEKVESESCRRNPSLQSATDTGWKNVDFEENLGMNQFTILTLHSHHLRNVRSLVTG